MALPVNTDPMQGATLTVLGIESSCDETAASVLRRAPDGMLTLLSSIVASQDEEHRPFGGVVPEIAARAHMLKLESIIAKAVKVSGVQYSEIDGVAATAGPGLIGGVIAGLMSAKGLAMSLGKPLIAVNHLEGHALSPLLSEPCPFPYLLLLISGGHSQLLSVTGLGEYERLGSTIDDAAGEAFDKSAKVMGLGFPGGPQVEIWAKRGDPDSIPLPRPLIDRDNADFSFAGLKTAVARAYEASDKSDLAKANICASFQRAVADVLGDRTRRAMVMFRKRVGDGPQRFVVAGGVAANTELRARLTAVCEDNDFKLIAPPLKFCGDNAAMIALAGAERLAAGHSDPLYAPARPRWPLDKESAQANPASGHGKKGPKS
ncbi:tRNA (adenosine(37)-N6)-threonylcarbamoyltransferase complex transferase subunit TsaD [Litorimonas sp. RW-G-Af-16]|uniref:tRNA (adenosine(37)-N6)-threonylcarbamoyltransferase complex transferase subunit TsaD n=1 Tax=Litorimonas sp. RW-G-Af-16 TaxID=3241168 RepID=UPI00390CC99D